MFNHAPADYICPLCLAINGIESTDTMMLQDDIVYQDDLVLAAINSKFVGQNPGHVIVFPRQHFENMYDLPEPVSSHIMAVAQRIALALKTIRNCDGIMLQQNNEPASGQHAFHYHLHIFPRFVDDDFVKQSAHVRVATAAEKHPLADQLRKYLSDMPYN